MKRIGKVGLLALLGTLLIYSGPIFDLKLKSAAWMREFPARFSGDAGLKMRIQELEAENAFLKSELGEPGSLTAIKVYSTYPFTTRSEFIIAAGERNGLRTNDTVVVRGDVLVGKVREVFESSAVVTTIFDPSWEIPVRIGSGEFDALLQGGNELTLSLIQKDTPIADGDRVISAGEGVPYGLEIGFIKSIKESSDGVFKEAVVEPSFRINNLRDVAIYR